jgi:hypothetical protein
MADEAWRKLAARKWAELEAIEVDGRTLFEDRIRKRTKGGAVEEVPIRVRVLRKDEARKAFFEAVKWAQEEGLLPVDLTGVANVREKALDPKSFDDLETICILSHAIREAAAPHEQHKKAKRLEAEYDMRSLGELWTKYKLYEDATDPREAIQTDAEFWAVAATIRSTGTIVPLSEFASHEQNAFILRTVDHALNSPAFRSWCTQFVSSTPAS